MKADEIERVFGRGRLRMATGEHVEVFREAVTPDERRRYTKRFLATGDADFRQWTEREWRILARLIGHGIRCVPDVVQFDGGGAGGMRQVQTYDAGVTVDQWATLLPVARDGAVRRHVFEDCAHWWALAHHCLTALDEIHALQLVHLDVKADNICIPYDPPHFDPASGADRLHVAFPRLALIDFAFSLVSRERLASPLPIGWQKDYDYQSPRLLRALEAGRAGDLAPTQELDWRCDFYSLAAMLRRYLPDDEWAYAHGPQAGWTPRRYDDARTLIYRLRDLHDGDAAHARPHPALIEVTGAYVAASDLAHSLAQGWTLAHDIARTDAPALVTPLTRIAVARVSPFLAAPIIATVPTPAVMRRPRLRPTAVTHVAAPVAAAAPPRRRSGLVLASSAFLAMAALSAPSTLDNPLRPAADATRDALAQPAAVSSTPPTAPAAPAAPAVAPEAPAPSAPAATTPESSPPAPTASATQPGGVHGEPPRHATASPAPEKPSRPAHVARERPAVSPHVRAAPPHVAKAPAKSATIAHAPRPPASEPPANAVATAPPSQAEPAEEPAPPPSVVASIAPTVDVAPPPAAAVAPPAVASEPARDKPKKAPRREPWRDALHDVLKLFGAVDQRAAPVEERSMPSGRTTAQASRPPDRPVQRVAEPMQARPVETPPLRIASTAPMTTPVPSPVNLAPRGEPFVADLGAQGRQLLAQTVPAVAAQARMDVSRVLWTAAMAQSPGQDRAVFDAAYVPWRSERTYPPEPGSASRAPLLYAEARQAYGVGRDAEALDLALQALAANPRDPDIASFLALLHLRASQPETARQLTLYALAYSGSRRSLRLDDWNTLAVASALTGREVEASRALLVELSLSTDVDRSCREARRAYAMYGERMRVPIEALLNRIRAQGRGEESPACAWPGYRTASRWQ
jgi:serine/threonine protein kinase